MIIRSFKSYYVFLVFSVVFSEPTTYIQTKVGKVGLGKDDDLLVQIRVNREASMSSTQLE